MFYTRVFSYLEALDINAEEANDHKIGWKHLKIMFECEDQQTLQTLNDKGTIIPESQKTPQQVLDTIATTIKSEDHFWFFQNEELSDVHQLPDEGIHALNIHLTTLVNQFEVPHNKTKEIVKIMVLQHAVRYHEAWDWIWVQD